MTIPIYDSEFLSAYIEAALWSSTDDDDEPLDKNYTEQDFDEDTFLALNKEASIFYAENESDIDVGSVTQAGHDLWLTRNGHGAGFWDGDWPEPQATRLTEASKRAGEIDLYVGDDGKIYAHFAKGTAGLAGHGRTSQHFSVGDTVFLTEKDAIEEGVPRGPWTIREIEVDGWMRLSGPAGSLFAGSSMIARQGADGSLGEVDHDKVDALDLYTENERHLYDMWEEISARLAVQAIDRKYDPQTAYRQYRILVERGAREYAPEYARGLDRRPQPYTREFPLEVRDAVTKRYVRDFEIKFKGGELEWLVPDRLKGAYIRAIR